MPPNDLMLGIPPAPEGGLIMPPKELMFGMPPAPIIPDGGPKELISGIPPAPAGGPNEPA